VLDTSRGRRRGLAGHAWFETYSVLTRLPGGLRRSPTEVSHALARVFPGTRFLDAVATATLRDDLARLRISGGAVFDALVAAVARHHDLPLLSCDARAQGTYGALGVRVELVIDRRPSRRAEPGAIATRSVPEPDGHRPAAPAPRDGQSTKQRVGAPSRTLVR
jgi:hypothetical protein